MSNSDKSAENTSQDTDEDQEKHFEVTCRRGNDDHLDVVTVNAETEKKAERQVNSESDVRTVLTGNTVEFYYTEDGSRRYGGEEPEAGA